MWFCERWTELELICTFQIAALLIASVCFRPAQDIVRPSWSRISPSLIWPIITKWYPFEKINIFMRYFKGLRASSLEPETWDLRRRASQVNQARVKKPKLSFQTFGKNKTALTIKSTNYYSSKNLYCTR